MSAMTVSGRTSRLALAVALIALAIAISALVAVIAHTLKHAQPVRSNEPPVSGVVWGDRVFVGPGSLAHWLKVRGIGYSVWAERHPPANDVLQRQKTLRDRAA